MQWERGRASGAKREEQVEDSRRVFAYLTSIDQPIETRAFRHTRCLLCWTICLSLDLQWQSVIPGTPLSVDNAPRRAADQAHGQTAVMPEPAADLMFHLASSWRPWHLVVAAECWVLEAVLIDAGQTVLQW